jgi:8-oxo-dGTP pyrophosphatase MutT (NUDIX family)
VEKHFTVTTYLVEKERFLLLYHPQFCKWLPPGGHLEEGETPPEGALRELREETGIEGELILQENVWVDAPLAKSFARPYLCLLEEVLPYRDKPGHYHMDLIYVARIRGGALFNSSNLRWFSLEEIKAIPHDEIFPDTLSVATHLFSTLASFPTPFPNFEIAQKETLLADKLPLRTSLDEDSV